MEVPEAGPVPGLSNPIQPGQILSDHYLQHYTVLHVTIQNYRSSTSPAQMVNYMGVCVYSFSGVMLASSHGVQVQGGYQFYLNFDRGRQFKILGIIFIARLRLLQSCCVEVYGIMAMSYFEVWAPCKPLF